MAQLILDLDLTVLVASIQRQHLHDGHTVSNFGLQTTLPYDGGGLEVGFELINPEELSNLIETAYEHNDGIIMLTSGLWSNSIVDILVEYLDLSENASARLRQCSFHSSVTDSQYFPNPSLSEEERLTWIQNLPKTARLAKIIELNPNLQGQQFVLLDNEIDHINAFSTTKNVTAVWADTTSPDKNFYDAALTALTEARKKEAISSSKVTYTSITEENEEVNLMPDAFFADQNSSQKKRPIELTKEVSDKNPNEFKHAKTIKK